MAPRLSRLLPIARWLPAYRRADAPRDLVAGVTTAVMLIPQGMAYAMLAGLPPIVGLYASTLPLVAYALVGTSRQLAIGPVAIDSLLVAAAVGSLASVGSDAYLAHAIALAAMVGIIEVTLGALRAGFLVNFLAQPVVSGFTSAAALVIGLSQAPNLLGVTLPRGQPFHAQLAALAGALPQSHAPTLLVGLAAIVLLLLARRLGPRVPGALLVVAITTLAVWGLDLDAAGVAIVGVVPAGLPPLALPTFELDALGSLLPTALTIAFVGYMEAISVARAFARKHRYEIDANQELLGLGLANAAASVCGGYPITGGFSRTAVNAQAGARTPLAGIITAAVIVAALLLLTPLLYYVPKATLAAIIVVAVAGLVDHREARRLARLHRGDFALLVITFVATLVLGISVGVLVGIGASLAAFLVATTRPHTAILGRLPGTTVYRNIKRFPEAIQRPGVIIVRIDASFYFGNVSFLKDLLLRSIHDADAPTRAVILDMSSVNRLDSSADAALHEILEELTTRRVALYLAGTKGPVRDVLGRSGFSAELGVERATYTVHEACEAAERSTTGAAA